MSETVESKRLTKKEREANRLHLEALKRKYKYVVAWLRATGSLDYYINMKVLQAESDGADKNAYVFTFNDIDEQGRPTSPERWQVYDPMTAKPHITKLLRSGLTEAQKETADQLIAVQYGGKGGWEDCKPTYFVLPANAVSDAVHLLAKCLGSVVRLTRPDSTEEDVNRLNGAYIQPQ